MADLVLTGLDGTNPLGFLAALGVLDAVSARECASLRWGRESGWRPVLTSSFDGMDALVACVDRDRRECVSDPALALEYDGKRDLKPPPSVFAHYLQSLADGATVTHRRSVDWGASFASDVAVDNNGNTKPTALHFTAGQQQFLQMVGQLVRGVTDQDIAVALSGPWLYDRPLPVMGWDATVSRDYALRAADPSGDKKLGVPGADWLAVRGLVFMQTAPRRQKVFTTCCSGGWKDGQFTWPLWRVALTRSVVRSLLGQRSERWSSEERRARGIGAVMSSAIRRSDQGGYGSFSPTATV